MTASIYVGTYEKYNNGSLFGKWLNLDDYTDKEDFYNACHELHNDEDDPEFMFQDYEGIPAEFISESGLSDKYFDYREIVENSGYSAEVFEAASDLDIPAERVEDAYQGEYRSDEDFAYYMAEASGFEQPDSWPYNCIDWERAARDLMFDYSESNGHYFSSNW